MTVSRPSLRIRRGRWRTRALAASPTAAERTARCSTGVRRAPKNSSAMTRSCSSHCSASSADPGRWSTRLKLQRPPGGQCAGGRECCEDRSRGSGCRWSCPFQRTIMGSPSRNVQYHPPRLSEDRLNLPQPHSPSLPTHCTAPGNRECAPPAWPVHPARAPDRSVRRLAHRTPGSASGPLRPLRSRDRSPRRAGPGGSTRTRHLRWRRRPAPSARTARSRRRPGSCRRRPRRCRSARRTR